MSLRPVIFISAVSPELKRARQLVADTLRFLGYEPEWKDISGSKEVDLRPELRRRVDSCSGVVQLVGECYGPEPPGSDHQFGRTSYTQYEALYAASKGKKVWYLFLDEGFPTDKHEAEDEEKQKIQNDYRAQIKAAAGVYHPLNSTEGLESSVLKLRDDLTRLRRGLKRWTVIVAVLLLGSVGTAIWSLNRQREAQERITRLSATMQQIIAQFPQREAQQRQMQSKADPEAARKDALQLLAQQFGLDPNVLETELPRFAEQLKHKPLMTAYERASAAYVTKDYVEAERLAMDAANEAQNSTPGRNVDAVMAFELAANACEAAVEYADGLKHLRDAEKLTDSTRDPVEWADVQSAIGRMLYDQGKYADAERVWRGVLNERQRALGAENLETLHTRYNLANALNFEGQYAAAEAEYQSLEVVEQKTLGRDHPDVLRTRAGLALALYWEGKFSQAETEFRAVIKLEEATFGPSDRETIHARNHLAMALDSQGKFPDAETEYRAAYGLSVKALGLTYPDTLVIRMNLAITLAEQGKYADAEGEFRETTKLEETVFGPDNPNTLNTRNNLALILFSEGKYAESEVENRALVRARERSLGPKHPNTLIARNNLLNVIAAEGRNAEAEIEYRELLELEKEVLGAEHPETLRTRQNLAETLASQSKYSEGEAEFRTVLLLREKVLGAEHPDTLNTRNGLAGSLSGEKKYTEAEAEYRAVLALREKVLGPEHPDTMNTCFGLATCLQSEGRFQEASALAKRAADGARKALGPEHPDTKKYEKLQEELVPKEG